MRAAVTLASLAVLLLAQPASSNILSYHCDGFSMAPNGDQVAVTRSFSGNGKPTDAIAIWIPKAETARLLIPGMDVNLELHIQYANPTKAGIGTVDSASLTLQALPLPSRKRSSESLQRDLAKVSVEASIDGKPPVPLVLDKDQLSYDLPMTAHSRFTIRFPGTARSIAFTVRDEKGWTIRTARYDLQQTAGRDAQFRRALQKADREALDYKRCTKMG